LLKIIIKKVLGDVIGMDISNKMLAWLVIAAIIISFAGTLTSLYKLNSVSNSGYFTYNDTGTATVDVSQSVILRYAINSIDFGAGSVDSQGGYNNCTLLINGSSTITQVGCSGFNNNSAFGDSFILENAGTSFLSVTLNFSKNATNFIGGNASLTLFKYTISNNESSSCVGALNNTAWTEVIENASVPICTNMSWTDITDSLRVGISIAIPNDVTSGIKTVSVLAQGTGI
jgi:hypothetical protein